MTTYVPTDAEEPDLDAIKENLWEDYLADCERTKTRPTMSDFQIWVEEHYE